MTFYLIGRAKPSLDHNQEAPNPFQINRPAAKPSPFKQADFSFYFKANLYEHTNFPMTFFLGENFPMTWLPS